MDFSPRGHKASDMTEPLILHVFLALFFLFKAASGPYFRDAASSPVARGIKQSKRKLLYYTTFSTSSRASFPFTFLFSFLPCILLNALCQLENPERSKCKGSNPAILSLSSHSPVCLTLQKRTLRQQAGFRSGCLQRLMGTGALSYRRPRCTSLQPSTWWGAPCGSATGAHPSLLLFLNCVLLFLVARGLFCSLGQTSCSKWVLLSSRGARPSYLAASCTAAHGRCRRLGSVTRALRL